MSDTGMLYFLPWLRRGLATSLAATGTEEGAPTGTIAAFEISVAVGDGSGTLATTPEDKPTQPVRIRRPGEVIGLNSGQVLRTEPSAGTQNFEANYFPYVELATPDLPWMFTPATAKDDRLVPWMALVVVRDIEGNSIGTKAGAPVRTLTVSDASAELPDLAECWAWAHVQSTADLSAGGGEAEVSESLEESPERFIARLICPRRLDDDSQYIAAIVPTFEEGRLAGLGLPVPDPGSVDTSDPDWWKAWRNTPASGDTPATVDLPVYYSWNFKTGRGGDFEELVERLSPGLIDAGTKDFDIGNQGTERLPPKLPEQKLVSWKGALIGTAITELDKDESHWNAFRQAMRSIVNDGLDGSAASDEVDEYDPLVHDPVVGAPAYGALPASEDEIPEPDDTGSPLWLGEVNLDPVYRSIAGLGSEVVRKNQEKLMASAWAQITSLREINRVLNQTRTAAEIADRQKSTKIANMSEASLLQIASPGKARLRIGTKSLSGKLKETSFPRGVASTAFRRIGRPEGPLGRAARVRGGDAVETPIATSVSTTVARACIEDLESVMAYAAYPRPSDMHVASENIPDVAFGVSPDDASPPGPAQPVGAVPGGELLDHVVPQIVVGAGDIPGIAGSIKDAIHPGRTLLAKMRNRVRPNDILVGDALPPKLFASPTLNDPMYDWLRQIAAEYLLPGVREIGEDTIGLTKVNAAFVESFLIGANHELAREFAWREYPANPSDTWLRVFWDAIPEAIERIGEVVEDILPLSGWSDAGLGEHQVGHGADGTLILVIKGELLNKYPDTIIYAVKAKWNEDKTGRVEDPSEDYKFPVFSGTLSHSTVFLGIDLDEEAARGDVDDGGWFFVFEEPPTEPRFGLDGGEKVHAGVKPEAWSEASWYHLIDSAPSEEEAEAKLQKLTHASVGGRLDDGIERPYDIEDDDTGVSEKFREVWGTTSHAGAMARITLQRPVRVLYHASSMLPAVDGSE